jgi:hypothetical protein
MSFNLPFGIRALNPLSNLDDRYGPHATLQDALNATAGTRLKGLTVSIVDVEYWFKDGVADNDLVEKLASKADLAGDATQTFKVNDGVDAKDAVNKSQLDAAVGGASILIGESFYYDENNVLRPNVSTFTQTFIYVGGPQIVTFDFNPIFLWYLKVNLIELDDELDYTYNLANPLEITILGTLQINDKVKLVYDHFINEPT